MFIFDSIEEKEKEEEEGEEKEEKEEEVDGKWQGTNGNCRRGFNLAAVIFKDGARQGFILFRILCNDRLMWVIVAVSADYRGFRPLQGSLPQSHRSWAPWWHGHTTDIVLEIVSLLLQPLPLPLSTSEPVSKCCFLENSPRNWNCTQNFTHNKLHVRV